jgi:hypothetical protein
MENHGKSWKIMGKSWKIPKSTMNTWRKSQNCHKVWEKNLVNGGFHGDLWRFDVASIWTIWDFWRLNINTGNDMVMWDIPSGNQNWLAGKSHLNGRFHGKIIELNARFSIATPNYQRVSHKISI